MGRCLTVCLADLNNKAEGQSGYYFSYKFSYNYIEKNLNFKLLMFQENIAILNSMDIIYKDIKLFILSENGVV